MDLKEESNDTFVVKGASWQVAWGAQDKGKRCLVWVWTLLGPTKWFSNPRAWSSLKGSNIAELKSGLGDHSCSPGEGRVSTSMCRVGPMSWFLIIQKVAPILPMDYKASSSYCLDRRQEVVFGSTFQKGGLANAWLVRRGVILWWLSIGADYRKSRKCRFQGGRKNKWRGCPLCPMCRPANQTYVDTR